MNFLTVRQAAERLGFTERWTYELLRRGELPGTRVGLRSWRVNEEVLDAYMNRGSTPPAGNSEPVPA